MWLVLTPVFCLKNMKFILGTKKQMTQLWVNDKVVAVTPVLAGPCTVTQVKTQATDAYEAVQVAFGKRREKNINKPQQGHFKAAGLSPKVAREFRASTEGLKVGDVITVGTFTVGDIVDVSGTSKGKGFQGVVKRHGFAGGRKTHGNKDQLRMGGSVGSKGPARIFKGVRMPGQMGNESVTVKNLEIIEVNSDDNLIYIKGALPGAINSLVVVKGAGELKVNLAPEEKEASAVAETQGSEPESVEAAAVTESSDADTSAEVTSSEAEPKAEEVEVKEETPVAEESAPEAEIK